MGRTKQTARRKRHNNQQNQNVPYERQPYLMSPKTNKEFESYYQLQGIVPEGEWDDFLEALRSPLPATFRITGFMKQSQELLKLIQGEYFDKLMNVEVEGRVIDPPQCLPWYPDKLAWQLDMDRKFIRQNESFKKLHKFLVEETESGNISRQEAVSMIPPLVMDVQPHHKVLDMCAAPGSKTAQLIEMLHSGAQTVPEGCVVGNDKENKRCYLMTHQVKRLESPCFIIINQDASCMPNFKLPGNQDGMLKSVKFDRVLADVPCSGDGTMRKNVDVWGKWNVQSALHLHNLQSRILSRGLEMLAIGGRIVYSTCSLNPIEDEAVVSNLLRRSKGTVRLVDVGKSLPGLKAMPGLSKWKVIYREMEEFTCTDELPDRLKNVIRPSAFPPSEEEVKEFNLHRCLRILPHHQDTGGFFISVLEKTDELPWVTKSYQNIAKGSVRAEQTVVAEGIEADNTDEAKRNTADTGQENATHDAQDNELDNIQIDQDITDKPPDDCEDSVMGSTSNTVDKRKYEQGTHSPIQKRRKMFGFREDPFIFLNEEDPVWPPIKDFFKLNNFPVNQLLVRCTEGKKRNLYFASKTVKDLVNHNIDRMKFINLGLKVLSRSESPHVTCPYRTAQEGVTVLYPYVTERVVSLTKEDIITLLSTEMPFLSRFSKEMQDGLSTLSQGSVIFVYDPQKDERPDSPKCSMVICGWLGRTSCRSFIAVNERGHYLRLCGAELLSKEQRLLDKQLNGAEAESSTKEMKEEIDDSVIQAAEVTDDSAATVESEGKEESDDREQGMNEGTELDKETGDNKESEVAT